MTIWMNLKNIRFSEKPDTKEKLWSLLMKFNDRQN